MPALNSRGLASHLAGRATLRAAAQVLATRALPVMPLKGIWLQQFVYADPSERTITDVDVLVPESRYAEAIATLREAGWEAGSSRMSETAMHGPGLPLPLDLHRRLYARGAFRMASDQLFARGTPDRSAFDVDLVLPDPRDVFAHLIGHFVKSRGAADGDNHELRDLPLVATRFELDPSATARHLEQCGLARASRYALACVPAQRGGRDVCREILGALAPDPLGIALATAMIQLRIRVDARSRLAALPGFVLERSVPGAAISAALRVIDRIREGR